MPTVYDQRTFTFSPLLLAPSTPVSYGSWERQDSSGAPWVSLGAGPELVVSPSWADVGASYRVRDRNGNVVESFTIGMPRLTGDPVAGAVGDGIADDTTALNTALDRARTSATRGVDLGGRTYRVTGNIRILNGVAAMFNGTIIFASPAASVYMMGRRAYSNTATPQSSNVKGCVLAALNIRMPPEAGARGIRGDSVSDVSIIGCNIGNAAGKGQAIGLLSFPDYAANAPGEDCRNLIIRNNVISLAPASDHTSNVAVYVEAPLDLRGETGTEDYWRRYFAAPNRLYQTSGVAVSGNRISGGYYGVGMAGVSGARIVSNQSTGNVRNVSVQAGSSRIAIADNDLIDSTSASIHMAYGVEDSVAAANTIRTARAGLGAEGLLQAYVGAKRNRFLGNTVECTSPSGCRWFIYLGVHAEQNEFRGNIMSGRAARAWICAEAGWKSGYSSPVHRGHLQTKAVDGFASASSWGNVVAGNIVVSSALAPVSEIQVTDVRAGESVLSAGCLFVDNTVAGRPMAVSRTLL